ncbi:hypothetical protein BXQ17_02030 [Polaribacter sp. BM10]|uniref:T9SS type A sorting domain-containing protein n=1 Tax=Polaribacter sp. BM10 TaxID=1529069 RepID=UPI00098ADF6E|nr:T9SS type A sorting domain-containing protein [Polaribacter sp. BM10]AQS92919.1 hypothetical protein BXQ17_02030 [Polaribacter sp. BM10]
MKKQQKISLLVLLQILFFYSSICAQTPGLIIEGADPNGVLDPNGDGYVSLPPSETPSQFTNVGFPANINATDVNDILYNEITYKPIPRLLPEPVGDISKGPNCGFTDMVTDANDDSTYFYTDGTNMLFRFRLGDAKPNSKGYSILIDTDQKFGFSGPNADPNAVNGNPGFEIEIVLRTNFTIDAFNIDGSASGGPTLASEPYTSNAIKSLALTTVCDDPDYFYDFYLPYASIAGLDATTKIRMLSITSIAPKEAIGQNTTSDIGGVDDDSGIKDDLFEDAINNQTPVDANEDPVERADCPQITGPIIAGTGVVINGTNEFVSGSTTEIEIFIDGVSQGSPTTTTTNGTWTYTIPGAITEGQKIKATATIKDGTTIVRGTSFDNCDIENVALTGCTPPAAPGITQVGTKGGKGILGTSSFASGIAIQLRIFRNGIELTSWGSHPTDPTTGYFTVTTGAGGSWELLAGNTGGEGFGNYTAVIMDAADTNCQSAASAVYTWCFGTVSGAITIDTPNPVLNTSSTISGTAQTDSTVRLFKNDLFTGLEAASNGSTAWSIDISSLELISGDVLYVMNIQASTECPSISSNTTVVAQSFQPAVNTEGCFDGNATQISGTSSEIGGTIRLYTRVGTGVTTSDSQVGTTPTVDSNGNWTVTGLNIPAGNYVAVTVQNTGEVASIISNEVLISSKTIFTDLVITSNPITEGDLSITGTSSGLPTGSTIQLYLDDSIIDGKTGTTDASGNWTIAGLDNGGSFDELYTDAVVTVTATSSAAGSCESDQSSSKVVVCIPPVTPTITAVTASPICENSIFTVTIVDAQPGLVYQLLDQDNNMVGPSIVGPSTAADKTIDSDPIQFGITSLKVRAFKILATCTIVESNSVQVVINPAPTVTFGPNPFATQNVSAQTVNLTYSATTNGPDQYSIDFDAAANTAGFVDVALTTLPVSPIVINVPANVAAGVYNASVTVKEPVNGCEKSYPITITILDPNAPMVAFGNTSVSQCSGITTADFSYSLASGDTPTLYTVDFNDVANLQGFLDLTDVALPVSPITITVPVSPNAGVYNGIIRFKTAGGIVSQEYPITISIEVTNPGIVGQNQIVSSGDDVAAFTSIQDATGFGGVTYQWQKSTTSAIAGFADIGGATSATFDDGTITQTTYYRRVATSVTNSCSTENTSNVITVTVLNFAGTPMITQVYQFGNERWVEITNIHPTDAIPTSSINVALFRDKNRVLDGTNPDAVFTLASELPAGESVLLKNTSSSLATVTGTPIDNDNLTEIDGGNDIIILSTTTGATAWENRYDIVSSIENKTSLVRIDETTATNKTYTESEWVTFIDNALNPYEFLSTVAERHPHDPLLSEITGANPDANTRLGLHRINKTTRTGNDWDNGFPDRSRFVSIAENYNHLNERLSARKLEVLGTNILGIEDQLLVVTNNLNITDNAEIRLIGSSQLVQTHPGLADISGNGKLYTEQNSTLANIYRYNYMSSPVTSLNANTYTVEDVLKDGTNPVSFTGVVGQDINNIARDINFVSGFDGSTGTPINIADYWIYAFSSSNGARANWIQKFKSGINLKTDGFIFKGPGVAQNYTFVGNPNDGEMNVSVGAQESYLLGNPFPSSLNALKFIKDNLNSIDGSVYLWDHVGEESTAEAIDGHRYNGYVGGYATINLSMGVSSVGKPTVGAFSITIEAENAVTNGTTITDNSIDVVTLNNGINFIEFDKITRATDKLTLTYKAANGKSLRLLVNGTEIDTYTLDPSTIFTDFDIEKCIIVGSTIRIESLDTNNFSLDNISISDDDGNISCIPSAGSDASLYKTPGTYIPIGQGFFVGGDADGGPIVFNNSQREFVSEASGNAVFFKTDKKEKKNSTSKNDNGDFNKLPFIKLGMDFISNEGSSLHRQIGVSFSSNNTFNFDKGYDSPIFDIGSTDIYWKFPNNESKYVIAGIQGFSSELEIPFEVLMDYDGTNILTIDDSFGINTEIFLKDKLHNTTQSLTNNEVALQLKKGVYTDRFAIVFKGETTLSVDDNLENPLNDKITIFLDNQQQELVIQNNENLEIKKVLLFNLLGQKMASWNIFKNSIENRLKTKNLSQTVYIVNVQTDKGIISKKIVSE